MSLTKDEVLTALKECYDPEIPVNIVDLGLVYDVRVKPTAKSGTTGDDIEVDMTLTAPGCPAHGMIGDSVRDRLFRLPGVVNATVTMIWEPAWTPERISPDARRQLGIE